MKSRSGDGSVMSAFGRGPGHALRSRGRGLFAALITAGSFAVALQLFPLSTIGQENKEPPPGAPTDQDPKAYRGLSAEQIERLRNDEIVILNAPQDLVGKKLVAAAMIVNQDIDATWNLLTQQWRQHEYIPGLHCCNLVEQTEDGSVVDLHVKVMTVSVKYRIRHVNEKSEYYIHWGLDPSYDNDLRDQTGYYRLYWIDEKHTLVRYGSLTELKLLLPANVQLYLTRQNLPMALESVKKWIDSGDTYRKKRYDEPEEDEEKSPGK